VRKKQAGKTKDPIVPRKTTAEVIASQALWLMDRYTLTLKKVYVQGCPHQVTKVI
jgi:hypothetical protein